MHQPPSILQKHFSASDTNFCYRLSKLQGIVGLERLGKLIKIPMTSFRTEGANFRLVAQCLNQVRYRVPRR
jgi:hypothetical protein